MFNFQSIEAVVLCTDKGSKEQVKMDVFKEKLFTQDSVRIIYNGLSFINEVL